MLPKKAQTAADGACVARAKRRFFSQNENLRADPAEQAPVCVRGLPAATACAHLPTACTSVMGRMRIGRHPLPPDGASRAALVDPL
eukprot:3300915-Prymnesium_polylepis.1